MRGGVLLEAVFGYWMEANGFSDYSAAIAELLRNKANEIEWNQFSSKNELNNHGNEQSQYHR